MLEMDDFIERYEDDVDRGQSFVKLTPTTRRRLHIWVSMYLGTELPPSV